MGNFRSRSRGSPDVAGQDATVDKRRTDMIAEARGLFPAGGRFAILFRRGLRVSSCPGATSRATFPCSAEQTELTIGSFPSAEKVTGSGANEEPDPEEARR